MSVHFIINEHDIILVKMSRACMCEQCVPCLYFPPCKIRYLSKKGCKLVAILCDYFVKTKSQTHRNCIIAKFANSVITYAHTYCHCSCAHFVNLANVSTRIARTLREQTLLASLREVFACVSLPFLTSTVRRPEDKATCVYNLVHVSHTTCIL